MKRILISAGTLVFIGALVISATGAFFSDTETSTGNTFAAGAIDLQIDNESYVTDANGNLIFSTSTSWGISDLTDQLFFDFEDLKPGDIGEDTISIHAGSNDAWACMALDITSTPDNGINEPEGDAGDVTDGATGGELQNFLEFAFWADDGDNVFESDEVGSLGLTGTAASNFDGDWQRLADSTGGFFGDDPIPGNTTEFLGKAWCFGQLTQAPVTQDNASSSSPLVRGTGFTCDGSGDNNIAQTDGIVVDVSFYAEQARNNAQFLCSGLPPFNGTSTPPTGPAIGAALGDYNDPTSCDVTATTTIQNAINTAITGDDVCVPDGTFTENVLINKDITLSGSGATSTSEINGNVSITANGATLEGFEINGNVSATASGVTIQFNKVLPLAGGNGITFGGVSGGATSIIQHNVVTTQALTSPNNRGIYLDSTGTSVFTVDNNTVTARKSGFGNGSSGSVTDNVFNG